MLYEVITSNFNGEDAHGMSTVSVIETLKQIGIPDLSRRTHISPDNIRKLLAGEFEAFSGVQFNGFVTISYNFV